MEPNDLIERLEGILELAHAQRNNLVRVLTTDVEAIVKILKDQAGGIE